MSGKVLGEEWDSLGVDRGHGVCKVEGCPITVRLDGGHSPDGLCRTHSGKAAAERPWWAKQPS